MKIEALCSLLYAIFEGIMHEAFGFITIDENESGLVEWNCHDQHRGRFSSGAVEPEKESDPGILSEPRIVASIWRARRGDLSLDGCQAGCE
jgi:hypothetical protein